MKLLLLHCLSFAALFYFASGQCGREIETYRNCIEAKDGTSNSGSGTDSGIPSGSISEQVIDCFTNNGCQRPTLAGDQAAGYETFMGSLIKCSDKVKDQIKPMIEQCMRNTPNIGAGFVLHPDLIAPLPLTMPNPPPAPPALVVISSAAQMYSNQICPANVNKDAVKSCVQGVAKRFLPFDDTKCVNQMDVTFELSAHCYNRETCKAQMSPTCKSDMEHLRAYLCNCAKQTFRNSQTLQSLVQTFKTCINTDFSETRLSKPSIDTVSKHAQTLLTNLMCLEAPDPCKPQTPQGQTGGQQAAQNHPGAFTK